MMNAEMKTHLNIDIVIHGQRFRFRFCNRRLKLDSTGNVHIM
jgi:hypothetical protein